jgi:hypothetical protein
MKTPTGWQCDRCHNMREAQRLPRGWHLRGGDHICAVCWFHEPAERQAVYLYHVSTEGLVIPEAFWHQQHARCLLWDGLVELQEQALARVADLYAVHAPHEAETYSTARAVTDTAWERVRAASPGDRDRLATEARTASRVHAEAYRALRAAAKSAGCDDRDVWQQHEAEIARAPLWGYTTAEVDGRTIVVRVGETDATTWRLQRSLADQTIDEYKTAWSSWIKHRADGRRMPTRHGMRLGDQVRAVLRYTNGQTLSRLEAGTPSLTLTPDAPSRSGRPTYRLRMAVGCGEYVEGAVVVHRPIPDSQDAIRRVELVGHRWCERWQWSLHITCRTQLAIETTVAPADAVAVDLRWRQDREDQQHLMVAEWLTTGGAWGHVLIDRAERCGRQHKAGLPSSWYDYLQFQSEVDAALEAVKGLVWQRHCGDVPYSEQFRLLRSRGLLRAREQYPLAAEELARWEADERTALHQLARLRDRLIARRDQTYYEQAHVVCRMARVIVIESDEREGKAARAMSIKALAEADDAVATGQRQLLAPGRFRSILLDVARRYGREVVLVDKVHTSTPCPECGVRAEVGCDDVTCECGHRHTRPEAATAELLRRWCERPGDGGLPGSARETEGHGKAAESSSGRRTGAGDGGYSVGALG